VRLLREGKLQPQPVATVPVLADGEAGLLGVAADPRFVENRRFYLYATFREGERIVNRVSRWLLAEDRRSAREERVIVDGIPGSRYHVGGRIRFGPDGMLWIGTGDAQQPARSQDRGSLGGKILRVTSDGEVPKDNPFPGSPVFALGVRNTQAFDWLDPRTLVVVDHGPSGEMPGRKGHDEVNVVRAGANLGWPEIFGCEGREGLTAPLLVWKEAVPPGGAVIYRGEAIPAWKGDLVVATLRSRHLQRIAIEGGRVAHHEVYVAGQPPAGFGRLREVVQAPDGALWVTTSNCDGQGRCAAEKDAILRIVAR
jgi:glucose/arabinose dehydrogenase